MSIYKIVSHIGDLYYIGSTFTDIYTRFKQHTQDLKCSSQRLFNEYGIENCRIVLYEEYPCDLIEELQLREGYWQYAHKCDPNLVNLKCPRLTEIGRLKCITLAKQKWELNNKEHRKQYQLYYNQKPQIKQYIKQFSKTEQFKINQQKYNQSEKGKEMRRKQVAKYHLTDKRKAARKKYRETSERYKQDRKEKVDGDVCGKNILQKNLSQHKKRPICQATDK